MRRYLHEEIRANHLKAHMDDRLRVLDKKYPFEQILIKRDPNSYNVDYHIEFKEGKAIDVYLSLTGKHIIIDDGERKRVNFLLSFSGLKKAQQAIGRIKKAEKLNST